jgi:hypothetical protein
VKQQACSAAPCAIQWIAVCEGYWSDWRSRSDSTLGSPACRGRTCSRGNPASGGCCIMSTAWM